MTDAEFQELVDRINAHENFIKAERAKHGVQLGESLLAHLDICECPE